MYTFRSLHAVYDSGTTWHPRGGINDTTDACTSACVNEELRRRIVHNEAQACLRTARAGVYGQKLATLH